MKRYLVGLAAAAALLTLTVGLACAQNKKGNPVVVLETSKGIIEVELNEAKAPISSKNFLDYVDSHFFDGLIFHRVIDNFMIQGGGFTADMAQKSGKPPIENEAGNGLTNDKYTLAMARTSVVNSATSQFFINTKDNAFLNHKDNTPQGFGYAVFGKVVKGQEVVDAIGKVKTGMKNGMNDVPTETVTIVKAYRKDAAPAEKK
ncbi:MAG TPA: peptidylprolyl isomerase [Candidatus Krumholzibacteria bacterium]|jgi:cyclophilin family peptidyl-prolyl cis-trans isomerase|nr:peptidylprolyl isomerase [Candidatus Krumholzibacteria bacterium]